MWVKNTYPATDPTSYDRECPVGLEFVNVGATISNSVPASNFTFVAKTGSWSLYETEVVVGPWPVLDYEIRMTPRYTDIDVWVDDLRIQPLASDMVCYVYDPVTFKPVVVFDDQHFGMYFQYNGEGKLIRKIKETVRGMKTIQESQYHVPSIDREYASSDVSAIVMGGDPPAGSSRAVLNGRRSSAAMGIPDSGLKASILSAELGLGHRTVKVFGIDADSLGEAIDRFKKVLDRPSLADLGLPQLEELRLLEALERVDARLDSLESIQGSGTEDEASRAAHTAAVSAARKSRDEIVRRLGISDDEAKQIISDIRSLSSSIERKDAGPEDNPGEDNHK
jgi:hypothetical protein